MELWQEAVKISKAVSHRIRTGPGNQVRNFAETMLARIDSLSAKIQGVDFSKEKEYFTDLAARRDN
jgi:hypothetical protein